MKLYPDGTVEGTPEEIAAYKRFGESAKTKTMKRLAEDMIGTPYDPLKGRSKVEDKMTAKNFPARYFYGESKYDTESFTFFDPSALVRNETGTVLFKVPKC